LLQVAAQVAALTAAAVVAQERLEPQQIMQFPHLLP
jgi:hypothetical protein